MDEKLQILQEEKHQLFLQLKKVLHEEEKRRRKEQRLVKRNINFSGFKLIKNHVKYTWPIYCIIASILSTFPN